MSRETAMRFDSVLHAEFGDADTHPKLGEFAEQVDLLRKLITRVGRMEGYAREELQLNVRKASLNSPAKFEIEIRTQRPASPREGLADTIVGLIHTQRVDEAHGALSVLEELVESPYPLKKLGTQSRNIEYDEALRSLLSSRVGEEITSYGRMEGTLTRMKLDGKKKFTVVAFVGNAVTFDLPDDLHSFVATHADQEVVVHGYFTQRGAMRLPSKGRVESIELIHRESYDVRSGLGAWSHLDWDGKSCEQIVNEVRDA